MAKDEKISPEPLLEFRTFALRKDPETMILKVVGTGGARHYRMARKDVLRLGKKLVRDAAPAKAAN